VLRSIISLRGFSIGARDGEIGKVQSFLFDDRTWAIRYLVVDTGGHLPGRKVLIAATALGRPDWHTRSFPIELTKQQVRDSPDIDTNLPISRQREAQLHRYYNWAPYWGTGYGAAVFSVPPVQEEQEPPAKAAKGNPNIRRLDHPLSRRGHAQLAARAQRPYLA
jgi:hypothetical protein